MIALHWVCVLSSVLPPCVRLTLKKIQKKTKKKLWNIKKYKMLVVKCEINNNHNKIVRNYNYIKIRCQFPDPNINYRELNLVFDL